MKDSYEIIANVVREFWKQGCYATDVIVFFNQKYSNDKKWEHCQELVMCHSDTDFEHVDFLSDFCEGQTEVNNIHIVELEKVTDFYYKEIYTNNHWLKVNNPNYSTFDNYSGVYYYVCPKCNNTSAKAANYCCNCGLKLRGDIDDE